MPSGLIRESMHVTTARPRAARPGGPASAKVLLYSALLASTSSNGCMPPSHQDRWRAYLLGVLCSSAAKEAAMTTKAYTVQGMTCEHCVRAVTDEVGSIPGVEAVEVDLESGTVRVSGGRLDDSAVAAAVDEAGYSVV